MIPSPNPQPWPGPCGSTNSPINITTVTVSFTYSSDYTQSYPQGCFGPSPPFIRSTANGAGSFTVNRVACSAVVGPAQFQLCGCCNDLINIAVSYAPDFGAGTTNQLCPSPLDFSPACSFQYYNGYISIAENLDGSGVITVIAYADMSTFTGVKCNNYVTPVNFGVSQTVSSVMGTNVITVTNTSSLGNDTSVATITVS